MGAPVSQGIRSHSEKKVPSCSLVWGGEDESSKVYPPLSVRALKTMEFWIETDYESMYNQVMGAKKTIIYPPWVEKYRESGKTIRRTKDGFALYHCTTKREEGKPPRYYQEYLGKITEEGFIPKKGTLPEPTTLEYGLSHLIWKNFASTLIHRLYGGSGALLKLGIIKFIFGSVDGELLRSSYLTYGDTEELEDLANKINPHRIDTAAKHVEQMLRSKFPDALDYSKVMGLLMICVVEISSGEIKKSSLSPCARDLIEQRGLIF